MTEIEVPNTKPQDAVCGVVEWGGGRYDFMVWRVGDQWYAAFPDYHASSRVASSTGHRADYVSEKMGVGIADGTVMAAIINAAISVATGRAEGSVEDFLRQVREG